LLERRAQNDWVKQRETVEAARIGKEVQFGLFFGSYQKVMKNLVRAQHK